MAARPDDVCATGHKGGSCPDASAPSHEDRGARGRRARPQDHTLLNGVFRRPGWNAHFRQTIRIVAACALADGFGALAGLKEIYWALITAVVVTQPGWDDTLAASRNRIAGTLIGAAAGAFVLEAARAGCPIFPLFWCTLLPLAVLTAVRPTLRLSCITLIVVVLIPSGGGAFVRPVDRVIGILLGTVASVIAAALIRSPADPRP